MKYLTLFALSAAFLASSCSKQDVTSTEFWKRLQYHCGKAYAGTVVSDDPQDADWRSETIIVHVKSCSDTEIRMPLHVGDDSSRTWVLTRDSGVITLRHDHRHKDGSEDAVSQYGGAASANSSGSRQNFPADPQTKAIFDSNDISVSNDNIWALEVWPSHDTIAYEMARPNRFFRVEFDTNTAVESPR